jgi:hypothetical protein
VRHAVADVIEIVIAVVAVLILVGIALVALKASRDNSIVSALRDTAKFLAGPFDAMFEPSDARLGVAVSWGVALVVYVIGGRWLAGVLRG